MVVAELSLLGHFRLRLSGGPDLDLPSPKDRALLAVLALHPRVPQSREKLAGLLWSDRGDAQARDSLKHALMHLRYCLAEIAPEAIAADRHSITLVPTALSIDVGRFEELLRQGTTEALEQAGALYAGDLLEGTGIRDSGFEDWLLAERRRLRRLAEDALTSLLTPSLPVGTRELAARRLLAFDPLREAACRALMQAHADRGERAQALKLYDTVRQRLHAELGVTPESETSTLYENIRQRRDAPSFPAQEPSPATRTSIAVLPFENLGSDPEQRYFSDGVSEDIITGLARNHGLFVIARNSSFQYRDQARDVKRIGQELGVQYIVEGSIRRVSSRIRIAVQLVDSGSGSYIWAERYDRDLDSVFEIQDQVTAAVVGAIVGQVEAAGIDKARRKRTDNLVAYDFFLRGLEHFNRSGSDDTLPARDMFVRAIEVDPNFARAYALLSWALVEIFWTEVWNDNRHDGSVRLTGALEAAQRAVMLDDDDALCHWALAHVHFARKSFDLAMHHVDRATKLNPSDTDSLTCRALLEVFTGRAEQALESLAKARLLNPRTPNYCYDVEGVALYQLRRYDEAARAFEIPTAKRPYIYRYLAAAYAQMGRLAEARAAVEQAQSLQPRFSIRTWSRVEPYQCEADLEHMREGMRKAGLPE